MRKLDYYWASKDEWVKQRENGTFTIQEDAPSEAQESYRHYLEQKREKKD